MENIMAEHRYTINHIAKSFGKKLGVSGTNAVYTVNIYSDGVRKESLVVYLPGNDYATSLNLQEIADLRDFLNDMKDIF